MVSFLEDGKYRLPDITEFKIGFECEIFIGDRWQKFVIINRSLLIDALHKHGKNEIRVVNEKEYKE